MSGKKIPTKIFTCIQTHAHTHQQQQLSTSSSLSFFNVFNIDKHMIWVVFLTYIYRHVVFCLIGMLKDLMDAASMLHSQHVAAGCSVKMLQLDHDNDVCNLTKVSSSSCQHEKYS